MLFKNKAVRPAGKIAIKTNALLRDQEKTLGLPELLMLRSLFGVAKSLGASANLAAVPEDLLQEIHAAYGETGLFKLGYLASSHPEGEFNHFLEPIAATLQLRKSVTAETELEPDNDQLRQSAGAAKLNLNVLQPSLSRKLYNPGRHPGYLVYGLGGPRILVSHPFQGLGGETYDVYNNSVDVVTSLMNRGYTGTFLFLDNLHGLNFEAGGVPAWLVWFSIIAAHSDLVLYVREYEEGFTQSQKLEIDYTPDRVLKKIVDIPHEELTWATASDDTGADYLYVGLDRVLTKEEFGSEEAKHAMPFIEFYVGDPCPRDRIFCLSEAGEITEYPLNHPKYGPG